MQFHVADFPFYTFGNLDNCHSIRHFVTSCGQGDNTDVNLRSPKGAENRRRLAVSAGFSIERLVTGEQTHSLNIAAVTEAEAGMGSIGIGTRIPNTDALMTNVPGICLMVLTADCVPIILYDKATKSVAAIHAGWRGTADGIAGLTVRKMNAIYGSQPKDIIAAIGPCIGTCCFEVDEDVAGHFAFQNGVTVRKPEWLKPHIDLALSNYCQLTNAGIAPESVEVANACTKCSSGEFFSHRYNKTLGRIGTGIAIVP